MLSVLARDQVSFSAPMWLTTPFPGNLMTSSGILGFLHVHGAHESTQAHIHIKIKKLIKNQ